MDKIPANIFRFSFNLELDSEIYLWTYLVKGVECIYRHASSRMSLTVKTYKSTINQSIFFDYLTLSIIEIIIGIANR